MKRLIAWILILALAAALTGCGVDQEALEGTWYTDNRELRISGRRVEIAGYYELDGQRMAGDIQLGRLKRHLDGTFTIETDSWEEEGFLKDEYTLVLGRTIYYK